MTYLNRFSILVLLVLLFCGCNKDNSFIKEENGTFISFSGELGNENLKSYWEDPNRSGAAFFKWAKTEAYKASMMSSVYDGKNYVKWNNGNYHSLNVVTPLVDNPKIANIQSLTLINPENIKLGSKIISFSPINVAFADKNTNNTTVASSSEAMNINVCMPDVFSQKLSGGLDEFKNYSYVYSVTDIYKDSNLNANGVVVANSKFKAVPSIFRINLKNNINSEEFVIKNITMTSYKDGVITPVFPDKLNFTFKNGEAVISEKSDTKKYYSKITTNALGNEALASANTHSYYMFVLPSDKVNAMEGVNLKFKVVVTKKSDGKDYVFNVDKSLDKLDAVTKEKRFKAGFIYTFNIPLNEDNIEKYHYVEGEYRVYMKSDKPKPVKIFISGDGYLASDFSYGGKFDQNADEGIEELFSVEPYKSYREYFSVYKIAFYSNKEGKYIGYSPTDTYFKTTINGVITQCDTSIVYKSIRGAMSNAKINNETFALTDKDFEIGGCIVLVNKDIYAGTCIRESTFKRKFIAMVPVSRRTYKNESFGNILVHEYGGHGFGKFADEYFPMDGSVFYDEWKPTFIQHNYDVYLNIGLYNDKDAVPWKDLIGREGYEHVNIYQGAFNRRFGVYRSEDFSCMRDSRKYFNSQCRKVIVKKILEAAGEKFDLEEFIRKDVQKKDNTVGNN